MVSRGHSEDRMPDFAYDPSSGARYLTPSEAAVRLRIAPSTLAAWRTGRGGVYGPPYAKIGGRVLYREADLEEFVSAKLRRHTGGGAIQPQA